MKITPFNSLHLPTKFINKKVRLVVFDWPYVSMKSHQSRDLFCDLIETKILGYQEEYSFGVLPVDSTDFVGTHLLLCEEKDSRLIPLMGFKSITIDRCKIHNLDFPVFNVMKGNELPQHRLALEKIIQDAISRNEKVAYNSSLTVSPECKSDPHLRQLCIDTTVLLFIKYYMDYNIKHILAAATLRFKVERMKEFVGFEYLSVDGKKLDSFQCKPFFGEQVILMHLQQFRQEAIEWAKRYDFLWNNRLVFDSSFEEELKKKAA